MFNSQPSAPPDTSELARRSICRGIGRQVLASAPVAYHERWLHDAGPPPSTPTIPSGSVWNLINNVKVLNQYTELVSEAASGHGPHAAALHGGPEACTGGLEWMHPLLSPVPSVEQLDPAYQQHIDLWRTSNPGLFSNAEAAYGVLQSYLIPDRNMTRIVVSSLLRQAKEYEVYIAERILGAGPKSFDEFQSQLLGWRERGAYHPLGLAACFLPCADQWVPRSAMHEADDVQALLDEFNKSNSVTAERLHIICNRLLDRTPALRHSFCALLDRVCVLMRVKSNDGGARDRNSSTLDAVLPALHFDVLDNTPSITSSVLDSPLEDASFTYTPTLRCWGRLKDALESACPPSLLCPSVCGSNRDCWGYPRLDLGVKGERLLIRSGRLEWLKKSENFLQRVEPGMVSGLQADRFQDILIRMGECATSPEISHLMLDPENFAECLAGHFPHCDQELYHDRARIVRAMGSSTGSKLTSNDVTDSNAFAKCIQGLKQCLPPVVPRTFPSPLSIMAWRVDCPSRVILYTGSSSSLDLDKTPPHALPKALLYDKIQCRTISGISMLFDSEDPDASLRTCLAHGVVSKFDDFACHPFHRVSVGAGKSDESKLEKNHLPTKFTSRSAPRALETKRAKREWSGAARAEANNEGVEFSAQFTSTTLAESLAVFMGQKPAKHTDVGLHSSTPWDKDHVDNRYAETQRAENGQRYRDWVTVYRDGDDLHRSRLASHHVLTTMLFHTHFPIAGADGRYSWVSVASTLPAETRVLRYLGGKTRLEMLKRSVENRFVNDSKLLPVWSQGDRVDQTDVEVYTDPEAEQVAVVYAPAALDGGRKRLELISFRFCE